MLQVINLTKIYNSKKGTEVRALDGVTLRFPEKGMVFLLGKSGSGKSTLLNVCGGLDSPTGGEIIVKGRSSKNFSQSDFDSYRNTFVGFIFQEYNILNEFSVEDNIALALELQGKSKDKKAIAELLEQVDLTGFAKRKPNTLSGGQKQRIAIARALVKNPEIIMADEPTGALDSNTGKQVFDTLKKLSQDKLVIVVSHDREFAEQYGDRIIELKDGKILSDITKTQQKQQALTQNVNAVGDVLCVKNGAALTDADFEQIKAFLKKSGADAIIASGEKDVKNFKKASHINDSGEKEVFADTDENNIPKREYTKEEGRFIRSKLPARHAVKIGLSGLKSKPFRLFLTILLCTVAFVMFGLLSTLNFYNSERTFRETITLSAPEFLKADKSFKSTTVWYSFGEEENRYESLYQARFTKADLDELKALSGDKAFGALSPFLQLNVRNSSEYWIPNINLMGHLPEGHELRNRITGEYADQKDEIVLSSYLAEEIVACQTYDKEGKLVEATSPQGLIGKTIAINAVNYKVVGIFDCGTVPEKFSALKESTERNDRLQMELLSFLQDGLFLSCFVNEERLEEMAKNSTLYVPNSQQYQSAVTDVILPGEALEYPEWGNTTYLAHSEVPLDWVYYPLGDKTAPGEGEVILSSYAYYRTVLDYLYQVQESLYRNEQYLQAETYTEIIQACSELMSGFRWEDTGDGKGTEIPLTDGEKEAHRKKVAEAIKSEPLTMTMGLKLFNHSTQSSIGEEKRYTVIGYYNTGETYVEYAVLPDAEQSALWNEQKEHVEYYEELISNYTEPAGAIYDCLFLPYDGSAAHNDLYWNLYSKEEYKEDDSLVMLIGSFVGDLRFADGLIQTLSKVFLYVGLVLAVFAALLLSNFITVSISQKKRDIGILRAVGARSFDVFKIFFSESFFIAILCSILAIVGSYIACYFINVALATSLGASLVVFGIPSVLILLGVAFLTAVIATFLPVYNAAKKKPVDSIRAI